MHHHTHLLTRSIETIPLIQLVYLSFPLDVTPLQMPVLLALMIESGRYSPFEEDY
jgi:hypothetical protein